MSKTHTTLFDWHKAFMWAIFACLIILFLAGCDFRDVVAGAAEGAGTGAELSGGNPMMMLVFAVIGALGGAGGENVRTRKKVKQLEDEAATVRLCKQQEQKRDNDLP